MKAGPEIVRAPVVVKVPDTLGKFVKSNVAVMVTGMAVEADAEGTEPIVKKAIAHSAIAAEKSLLCRIISILFVFVFIFVCLFVCWLNCINCNPVPRGTRNHPHEALWNSGLTSADSGLQLDLEIALSGVSAPNAFGVETSGDVIDFIRKAVPDGCRGNYV